jgi:hypothetical protein
LTGHPPAWNIRSIWPPLPPPQPWSTGPPGSPYASPAGRPIAATSSCGQLVTCGRGCWIPTDNDSGAGCRRSSAIRRSAESWREETASESYRRWGHGRCCAATATLGTRPPDGVISNSCRIPTPQTRPRFIRWYCGTFLMEGRRVRLPVARGCPALWVRLARPLPYPVEQVRAVTLLADGGRLWLSVTAAVPVSLRT